MIEPNVLVVSHLYPSSVDPTNGNFIHNEVKALRGIGLDARVVAPVPWAPLVARIRPKWRRYDDIRQSGSFDCVAVERIGIVVAPRPFHVVGGLTMALRLRACLVAIRRNFPFNIIHAHTLTPDGFACCLAARHFNVPTVCTIRGSDLNKYPHEHRVIMKATRFVLHRTDALIATSKALSDEAAKMTNGAVRPVPIYKGVDFSCFENDGDKMVARRRTGLSVKSRYIVFVGRCEQDKGLGELFNAYLAVRRDVASIKLLIVGSGGYLNALRRRVAETETQDAVVFTGRIDPSDVRHYLTASDLFVLPSYGEGMPNALLEAMACGLPSIASAVGGIPEVMDHEVSGLLIPPRNTDALEVAMRRMLGFPEFAQRLGAEAAKRIRQKFSWRSNAEQNMQVYRKVLKDWTKKQSPRN